MHAYVHRETCIQCGLCPGVCPEVFSILPGESAQAITEPVPQEYLAAAQEAAEKGRQVSVLKLGQIHPLDSGCIQAASGYRRVLFFEEGSPAGGVGEHFGTQLSARHYAGDYRIHAVEPFVSTCKTEAGLRHAGLDVDGMLRAIETD